MAVARDTAGAVPRQRAPVRAERRWGWLLFVHQLPTTPSHLRVKTWRRLQQLGAVALKQAVYALPESASAREDFEWLRREVEAAGGEALIFSASSVDPMADDTLVDEFRRVRQESYTALARDVEAEVQKRGVRRRQAGPPHAAARALAVLRQRFVSLQQVDFFGSAGRDRVASLLAALEEPLGKGTTTPQSPSAGPLDRARYRARLWATRPRPGVDRISSAWLIRQFVDPDARFAFATAASAAPDGAVGFDMYDGEFTHRGDHCTFETLCDAFSIVDQDVARIAAIVHDLDLKDARFGAPEAPLVATLIDGLQRAHADDQTLLAHGMVLFDALYRGTAPGGTDVPRPRPVVGGRGRAARGKKR